MTAVAVERGLTQLARMVREVPMREPSVAEVTAPDDAARTAVSLILAALTKRVPFHRVLRVATMDVATQVETAAMSVPSRLRQFTVGRVRMRQPRPTTVEVVVVLVGRDAAAFVAFEMRWWRLDRRWVVSAFEFGWPPDTRTHHARAALTRSERRDEIALAPRRGGHLVLVSQKQGDEDDEDLDRRMAVWSEWDGVMSATTFTVSVIHRSSDELTSLEGVEALLRLDRAFGSGWMCRTERLSGLEYADVLRATGRSTVDSGSVPGLPM